MNYTVKIYGFQTRTPLRQFLHTAGSIESATNDIALMLDRGACPGAFYAEVSSSAHIAFAYRMSDLAQSAFHTTKTLSRSWVMGLAR